MPKQFAILAHGIKPLATGRGSCLATDEITVKSCRVGYMYREAPDNAIDSGWRFFAGHETQEYADDPRNLELYDVNTIANYDPEIIPLLDAPFGSVYVRETRSGPLVPGSR